MKNKFLLFLAVTGVTLNVSAQSWSLFGGDNIISNEYLGGDGTSTVSLKLKTVTNYPMEFFTNNTERMRIDTNGNVGIGTATPSHTLDVNGTVAAKQILIEEKDILALLTELQSRIAVLEKKLPAK